MEDQPDQFCSGNSDCSEKMIEIANLYKNGTNTLSQQSLIGMSGACYHISSLYDKEHEHHGAFVFERASNGAFETTGLFSFFAEEDPYKNLNAPQMKEWFIRNNSRFTKAIENSEQVEIRYLTDESDIHYWFRGNNDNNVVTVIGRQFIQDYVGYIFCKFKSR